MNDWKVNLVLLERKWEAQLGKENSHGLSILKQSSKNVDET